MRESKGLNYFDLGFGILRIFNTEATEGRNTEEMQRGSNLYAFLYVPFLCGLCIKKSQSFN